MGNCIRSVLRRLQRNRTAEKTITLLIAGLDNAGKSLILNHISGDPDQNVLPTMGFRVVSLKHKSYLVKIYDLGGSSQIRALWPKYYNDIHGVIYVVDASDISRLAENKIVFNELITHEHISTKPLLLLANKQDLNEAIDELDLVERLDVERVVNATRCPARVETCSCVYNKEQSKNNTMGITNGYKWLLDTIVKNYAVLNNRIKQSQNSCEKREKIKKSESIASNTPSKISIHSNPFKPIKDLLASKDEVAINESCNGTNEGKSIIKAFVRNNKTVPLPVEQSIIECENFSHNSTLTIETIFGEKSTQTMSTIFDPSKLNTGYNGSYANTKLIRPYTAPERSQLSAKMIYIINIPGQVSQ